MRWRRASLFDVRNSILMGYMDAGLSMESDSTASFYKHNVSGFNTKQQECYQLYFINTGRYYYFKPAAELAAQLAKLNMLATQKSFMF